MVFFRDNFMKLQSLLLETRLWIGLVIVNLLGTAYGFYFYGDQFRQTSMLLWVFVADSPLSTLGIAAAILWRKLGEGNSYLDAYAFMANLKYGLWTVAVLLIYFGGYTAANSTPLYIFLLLSHLGMAAQAFLISDIDLRAVLSIGVFFAANDFLDYFIGIHPFLPADKVIYAAVSAAVLTAMVVIAGVKKS